VQIHFFAKEGGELRICDHFTGPRRIFALCDSIAVIAGGRLSSVRPIGAMSVEEVGLLMGKVDNDDQDTRKDVKAA
jgi:hypothetical protein